MHLHATYPITAQRKWELERHYGACSVLYGGAIGQPIWTDTPLSYSDPPWVWNAESGRYHWRRPGKRKGKVYKKGAFHPVPDTPKEQRLYRERLARREDVRRYQKQGHRLKKHKK